MKAAPGFLCIAIWEFQLKEPVQQKTDTLATAVAMSKKLSFVSSLGGSGLLQVPMKLCHVNLWAWKWGDTQTLHSDQQRILRDFLWISLKVI